MHSSNARLRTNNTCLTNNRCRAGEQVMLCYGTYDNLQLLGLWCCNVASMPLSNSPQNTMALSWTAIHTTAPSF